MADEKKFTLSKLAIRRLEGVIAKLRKYPNRFDQSMLEDPSDCSTTYCIGGWLLVNAKKKISNKDYNLNWRNAVQLLGLPVTFG